MQDCGTLMKISPETLKAFIMVQTSGAVASRWRTTAQTASLPPVDAEFSTRSDKHPSDDPRPPRTSGTRDPEPMRGTA